MVIESRENTLLILYIKDFDDSKRIVKRGRDCSWRKNILKETLILSLGKGAFLVNL
jgi:hypothetical protein